MHAKQQLTLCMTSVALLFCVALATPAHADLTFPLMIKGHIYVDGAVRVRVNCSFKEGNTIIFIDGDISLSPVPILNIATSCELHSDQGVFTNGERFNGEPIDEDEVITTILNARGKELYQYSVLQEIMGTGGGMSEIILEYKSTFVRNSDTWLLEPPLRKAGGRIKLVNHSSSGEIFVGTWKTGRPLP